MSVDESKILTVSQLNEFVKRLIDGNPVLGNVWIRGEISNFVNHRTGHLYFTMKDENSVISAVMFRAEAAKLRFIPENGMKIILHGRVSVYPKDGRYQLYAASLEPDGIGALYVAFEQLKRKLEEEGLFDQDIKKPLPKIPSAVGIITSPTGAAVRDMINVTGRRFPYAKIMLFPALVQGEGAEAQLVEGIRYFGESRKADVVIIGRGGGSLEDLWAFNSEKLAREIRKSTVPVISAVGHETDFTICDFAADLRAPTPSAAAEIAVPDSAELKRKFGNITGRMELLLSKRLEAYRSRVNSLSGNRTLTNPGAYVDDRRMSVLMLSNKLEAVTDRNIKEKKNEFKRLAAVLDAVNPLRIISKGYSAVFSEGGDLIKSVKDTKPGDNISFRTSDGEVDATVTGIREAAAKTS